MKYAFKEVGKEYQKILGKLSDKAISYNDECIDLAKKIVGSEKEFIKYLDKKYDIRTELKKYENL